MPFEVIKAGGHNFGPAQYERLIPIVRAFTGSPPQLQAAGIETPRATMP